MKIKEVPETEKKVTMKTKIMVSLFRQKELLKKDILRKRALLEKELQFEIQVIFLILNFLLKRLDYHKLQVQKKTEELFFLYLSNSFINFKDFNCW